MPALALPHAAKAALAGVLVFATAVWAGGLVAIFVVDRVASVTLQPADRVAFFRGLGRAYWPAGGLALAVALAAGAVLAARHPWDGLLAAATVAAGGLIAATVEAWVVGKEVGHPVVGNVLAEHRAGRGLRLCSALARCSTRMCLPSRG